MTPSHSHLPPTRHPAAFEPNSVPSFPQMATNSVQGKWFHQAEEEEDEEEEALSLCDLPVIHENQPTKEEYHSRVINETTTTTQEEEFDFNSWGGGGGLFSNNKEPQMCVADEVFFQGQILPLRLSFSSEAGLLSTTGLKRSSDGGKQFNRCGSFSEFRSSNSSSRSSSLRSQNSSSSTSSTTTTTTTTTPIVSKPRVRNQNQFHTHPSPKPQLRSSGPRQNGFLGNPSRKSSSSVWEIFRLGVVPAPEIGLQDLKVRSSSSNSASSVNNTTTKKSGKMMSDKNNKNPRHSHHGDKRNHVLKQFVGKGGGLLSGCDCSIETVQKPDTMVMIKGGTKSTNKAEEKSSTTTHAVKEKVLVELKKQRKKVMSRRRTFEWLKEIHATHPDEEAALLSSNTCD